MSIGVMGDSFLAQAQAQNRIAELAERMEWFTIGVGAKAPMREAHMPSLHSLYSMLSTRACQLASITFSWTPTVPQVPWSSALSMITRTLAAVAASELMTRTL